MSDKFYSQARKVINGEIEWCKQRLAEAEFAATNLATALINEDPLMVDVTIYDGDQEIDRFRVLTKSLESAWRVVLERYPKYAHIDFIDMVFMIGDKEYMFSFDDIQAALENVRYESAKERAAKLEGEQWHAT